MTDSVTIRAGVNFDLSFDTYTDSTHATRITYTGWTFILVLARTAEVRWSTTDVSPALTVQDATNPTGKRLVFHLNAAQATTVAADGRGRLYLLRVDPADATNVEVIAGPTRAYVSDAP